MDNNRNKLNSFFSDIQPKALRHIEFSISDRDEALDLLQEAMIRLAKNYAHKPDDWGPLLQRIIQNLVRDWHRRKKVRSILFFWQNDEDKQSEEEALTSEIEEHSLSRPPAPDYELHRHQLSKRVVAAVKQLPTRQQEAFTLRAWMGHDTQETACAMGYSEGSVKTHYSRALTTLRHLLGDERL